MKDYFTIGELSELFRINTQTLRYYDSIGLFSPLRRDEETGYRYYQFNQLYELASIRYLRKLGYSIRDIDTYMKTKQIEAVLRKLKEQSKILHNKWDELIEIDNIIQRKIRFIEEELPLVQFEHYEVRSYPKRCYLPIGSEEALYGSDVFYFHPTIAFYRGDQKYFGAYLQGMEVKNQEYIQAGDYLCAYHKGLYDKIEETIEKMRSARPELKLDDLTINFNIIDQFVEKDVSDYVTLVQIRILPS